MERYDENFERARYVGRFSLGLGIASLMLPWTPMVSGTPRVWASLAVGIFGVLVSLPGLGARSSVNGSKAVEPMAGLIASTMGIFVSGVVWFFGLALSQHVPS